MPTDVPVENVPAPAAHADTGSAPSAPPNTLPLVFIANVVVIGLFGLAISLWLLYYTDSFETAASLFALTGAFSWIATVSKLLPKDRLDALQRATDRFILNSWIVLGLILISGGVFAWWANGRGTIQIQSRRDVTDRSLTLTARSTSEQLPLQAGGRVRFNETTSRSAATEVLVKVSGFPDSRVKLLPWQRVSLHVPSSFLRPVILAKPDVDLIDQRDQQLRVVIKLNGKAVSDSGEFSGYAFWLGGDDDIEIPSALQDSWRDELARRQRPFSVRFWQSPVVLPGNRFELKPQDQLCVELQLADQTVYLRQDIVVKPLQKPQDFPQVEDIHDRDPSKPVPPHC
jgi:hypothetical protein